MFAAGLEAIYLGLNLGIAGGHPLGKTLIGHLLGDGSFGDSILQVFAHHHPFVGENGTAGVGGLGSVLEPLDGFIQLNVNGGRVGVGVVGTQTLNESPVSWSTCIRHHNMIKRTTLFTMTL